MKFCEGYAVPAYPHKISFKLKDGSEVTIKLRGDEFNKWATTTDNYTLLPKGNEWFFATVDSTGNAICSTYKLCADSKRSDSLQLFLTKQPKGISPKIKISDNRKNLIPNNNITQISNKPVVGERRALVILMHFPNLSFIKSKADFEDLFNKENYNIDGAQGSVYDYFCEASNGQLSFHCDVLGPYKASHDMYYYGSNGIGGTDTNPYELFQEAVEYAAKEVNFADYDTDKDGYLDNFHIIFAGYGEEAGGSPSTIWSHEATFPPIMVDGARIASYSCTPELRGNNGNGISRIGACCHEMGHALGAMDYYDTDYAAEGSYEGTGEWDIMAQGSWNNDGITPAHFNPYVMAYNFGWVDIKLLSKSGDYTTTSTSEKDVVYRINTASEGDYYLLEERTRTGFDSFIPGEGLMIYHVNPLIEERSADNTINNTSPQMMYPVCASSTASKPSTTPNSYGDINSTGCPFPGNSGKTTFDKQTIPSAFAWDGSEVTFKISEIKKISGKGISFRFTTDENNIPNSSELETIWNESFEDSASASHWMISRQLGFPDEWEYFIDKTDEWGLTSSWDEISEVADGFCCMRFVQKDIIKQSKGAMVSPPITDNSNEDAKLLFYYQNKTRLNGQVTLEIFCKEETADEWTPLLSLDKTTNGWEKQETDLPSSNERLQIMFLASTKGTSGVYVDNISILKPSNTNSVLSQKKNAEKKINIRNKSVSICIENKKRLSIYSIEGKLILSETYNPGEYTFKLSSGIYILRNGENIQKIYIP